VQVSRRISFNIWRIFAWSQANEHKIHCFEIWHSMTLYPFNWCRINNCFVQNICNLHIWSMHNVWNSKSIAKSGLFAIGLHALKDLTDALVMLSTLIEVHFSFERGCVVIERGGGFWCVFVLSVCSMLVHRNYSWDWYGSKLNLLLIPFKISLGSSYARPNVSGRELEWMLPRKLIRCKYIQIAIFISNEISAHSPLAYEVG